jgi:hypothetical protein
MKETVDGWENGDFINLNANASVLDRAYILKKQCVKPPLVGIAATDAYMRNANFSDQKDVLHGLFLRPDIDTNDPAGYPRRVYRGEPQELSANIDIVAQEWKPVCDNNGNTLDDFNASVREIEARLNQSTGLLSNFSRPSLIWSFGFPANSKCNQSIFLSLLFNNTGKMVDAGIIGLIYDGGGVIGKKTDTFCEIQKNSKKVLGYMEFTYGRKEYAIDGACSCSECDPSDFLTGQCNKNAAYTYISPQFRCPDGSVCKMPSGTYQKDYPGYMCSPGCTGGNCICTACTGGCNSSAKYELPTNRKYSPQYMCDDGSNCMMPDEVKENEYGSYKCAPRCVSGACKSCNSTALSTSSSFCVITETDGLPKGYTWPFSKLSDEYWEFLTGLPPKDKCCLQTTSGPLNGTYYTYGSQTGAKSRSEFLQFPRRGEEGQDCGRAPDTSILTYCGIRVPVSQKKITCAKVTTASTQTWVDGMGLPVDAIEAKAMETGLKIEP